MNPSNSKSFLYSHAKAMLGKAQARAGVLASQDAAVGSDGERVQRKGNSTGGISQPGQTAQTAQAAAGDAAVTLPRFSAPMGHPPCCSGRCNTQHRWKDRHVCALILPLPSTQCPGGRQ